jgi:cytochrome P450 / NADPH-cytochrome P450 reductase
VTPIPQPPPKLLVHNLLELSPASPVQDMMALARKYGPIYRLDLSGRMLVVVSSQELVHELSDEKRFDKAVRGALKLVRRFAGDGLFTARTEEPNWAKAHTILLPNFGHKAMLGYHPMMLDIAEQLVAKWERLNPDDEIEVTTEMTSLTVDTIGLCGFDYRFNSFYHDGDHPFVNSMASALGITMDQIGDLPLEGFIRKKRNDKLDADVGCMNGIVDEIIRERKAGGEDLASKPDLLSYMLSGVDKKTGEGLDDLNIRYQVITFLIAGHETTSGLLSFAIYGLLNNPEVLAKAYEEVDRVLGSDRPTYAQVNQLQYISQILKEALRLWPTAPAYSLSAYEATTIGGKYQVDPSHQIVVLLPMLHRDPAVWGTQPEVFEPDHFSRENESQRPPNAWKPFGNGQRSCIGRQFALQEAALVLGMILQRFTLLDHNRYQLKIRESLTMKPDGFKIKVRQRTRPALARVKPAQPATSEAVAAQAAPRHGTPLLVLFGSNMGGSEELARRIAHAGEEAGFAAQLGSLDDYARRLPKQGLVIVSTASYNGLPPDNAIRFCEWLRSEELTGGSLSGVNYVVFGCGNRDWASTFQAVPRLVDARLAAAGARRLYPLGEGDAREDFDEQFRKWHRPLWAAVAKELGIQIQAEAAKPLCTVEIVPGEHVSPFVESFGAAPMALQINRELHSKDGEHGSDRSTRHLELQLPEGVTYRAGDHLAVIARNADAVVQRTAARFGFAHDTFLRLRSQRQTFLPTGQTISLYRLLGDYVELQEGVTRAQLESLLGYTECPPEKMKLAGLASDETRYKEEVRAKRKSLLDVLEEFPSCALPLGAYLEMLSPLRPRYYSISSSSLVEPRRCSLTVAVTEGPARSGRGEFHGVCSSYLRDRKPGDILYAFVRDTKSAFRLPQDSSVPVILVGPGTGLAPFRGFLQERAALKLQGQPVGPSLLFFGCRHPQQDFLYEEELRELERQGVTQLATAFSRVPGQQKCYVQDEIYARRAAVWQMLEDGAAVYVCGDATRMAPDVRRAFATIHSEKTNGTQAEAEQWLNEMTARNRYLVDVWSAN